MATKKKSAADKSHGKLSKGSKRKLKKAKKK